MSIDEAKGFFSHPLRTATVSLGVLSMTWFFIVLKLSSWDPIAQMLTFAFVGFFSATIVYEAFKATYGEGTQAAIYWMCNYFHENYGLETEVEILDKSEEYPEGAVLVLVTGGAILSAAEARKLESTLQKIQEDLDSVVDLEE
jgi:hypothetical protein